MDVTDQVLKALLDGADHGAAQVVTLGTTAAAAALWRQIKSNLKRRGRSLTPREAELLSIEPGDQIDLEVLRKAVQLIPPGVLANVMTVHQEHVAGDAVHGEKRVDAVYGDQTTEIVYGDKIMRGDKVEGNVYYYSGVQNFGSGAVSISGSAVGDSASVLMPERRPRDGTEPGTRDDARWDVGAITVLSEETTAVTAMMRDTRHHREQALPNGLRFHEATFDGGGQRVNVVATQALDRGQRPSVVAFEQLRTRYAPVTVALVGIAGGIHPAVGLGDVVVTQEIIYYDNRKEERDRISYRGQARPVPASTRRAINAFFSDFGEPCQITAEDPDGVVRTWRAMPGPIGSGEAVIANRESEIREYIRRFNDKTLALETEAAGLAEAFYETADTTFAGAGWLSIRGISDHADAAKNDSFHAVASWHAAVIFRKLLPYLKPQGAGPG